MLKMFRNIALVALAALLAVVLSACGGTTTSPTDVPNAAAPTAGGTVSATTKAATTVAGGTTAASTKAAGTTAASTSGSTFYIVKGASATDVPSTLQAGLTQYQTQVAGSKAQAFKVSSDAATVKGLVSEAFKKEGWTDLAANAPTSTANGFTLTFTKNNKGAAVVGFPGTIAGLAATDTIYIVFVQA